MGFPEELTAFRRRAAEVYGNFPEPVTRRGATELVPRVTRNLGAEVATFFLARLAESPNMDFAEGRFEDVDAVLDHVQAEYFAALGIDDIDDLGERFAPGSYLSRDAALRFWDASFQAARSLSAVQATPDLTGFGALWDALKTEAANLPENLRRAGGSLLEEVGPYLLLYFLFKDSL